MARLSARQINRRSLLVTCVVFVCMIGVASCSGVSGTVTTAHVRDNSVLQTPRDYHVLLAPILRGGTAGWCLTVVTEHHSSCAVPEASDGPVFVENCERVGPATIGVSALTTNKTTAVSIAGGPLIPTRAEPSLADGLRAVFVEIHYQHRPKHEACPKYEPFNPMGKPVGVGRAPDIPLGIQVPGRVEWRRVEKRGTVRPPDGVCEIGPFDLPQFSAHGGIVVRRIVPSQVPLVPAFASCASTDYFSRAGILIEAAVLLDASHPGIEPARLPGMKPVARHPGTFEAQGPEGRLVGRRIHGAWLIAEEGDSGRGESLSLLEHLRATVNLG